LVVTVYNHVIYSESYAHSSQVDIVEVQNLNCLILQARGSNSILRLCSHSSVYQYYGYSTMWHRAV